MRCKPKHQSSECFLLTPVLIFEEAVNLRFSIRNGDTSQVLLLSKWKKKKKGVWTLVRKTCIKGVIAIRRHSKPQPDKSQGRSR